MHKRLDVTPDTRSGALQACLRGPKAGTYVNSGCAKRGIDLFGPLIVGAITSANRRRPDARDIDSSVVVAFD